MNESMQFNPGMPWLTYKGKQMSCLLAVFLIATQHSRSPFSSRRAAHCTGPHRQSGVLQFEAIAGFSAIIDRLGEFNEVLEPLNTESQDADTRHANIVVEDATPANLSPYSRPPLLSLEGLTLRLPNTNAMLIEDLWLEVRPTQHNIYTSTDTETFVRQILCFASPVWVRSDSASFPCRYGLRRFLHGRLLGWHEHLLAVDNAAADAFPWWAVAR